MDPKCAYPAHRLMPVLIILFGLLFLFNALGYITPETTAIVWPLFVIVAGLKKLFMDGGCCKK